MVRRVKFDNTMQEKESHFHRPPSPYPSLGDNDFQDEQFIDSSEGEDGSSLDLSVSLASEDMELDEIPDLKNGLNLSVAEPSKTPMSKAKQAKANKAEAKLGAKRKAVAKQTGTEKKRKASVASATSGDNAKAKSSVVAKKKGTPVKSKKAAASVSGSAINNNKNNNNTRGIDEPNESYTHGKDMIFYSEGTPCIIKDGQLIANDVYNKFILCNIKECQLQDVPGLNHLYKRRLKKDLDIEQTVQLMEAFSRISDKQKFIEWLMQSIKMEQIHATETHAALRDYMELSDM